MNIHGNNVVLRAISLKDAKLLMELINDADTEKMLGGSSFPVSMEEQEKWIMDQNGKIDILRSVVAKKDNEDDGLGTVILSDIDYKNGIAQVHIKMSKNCRGAGYGADALNAIVAYAFNELRMNCIYANVLSYNEISQKLFQKVGFKRDGVLRSRVFKAGKFIDMYSYSLLKSDTNYD